MTSEHPRKAASPANGDVTENDFGETSEVKLDDTPLTFLLKDMASQLHRYYTDLIEPTPGIEARWKLEDGNPLCESGRRVVTSIPDFVLDSKGHRNFPGRGGRLWYMLLRTSRRAQFEDARPYLVAASKDLKIWLSDQYPKDLPQPIVVADVPFSVRLENLRVFLSVQKILTQQNLGTRTDWFAAQHPLFNAAVEVLVAIPDAIAAPNGTPNFPGVGSHLWPQLKNSLMTAEDSPMEAKRRAQLAQQFRDWLSNRYHKDLLEATGIQATSALHEHPISAENTIGSTKKTFDVYLSYNATDREIVEPLVLEFEKRGLTVFLDTEHISFGDNWSTVLLEAIQDSRCVVFCVSKSGLGRWQRREFESYIRDLPEEESRQFLDRTIPVLLPDAPDSHEPSATWNTQLWLDFRNGLGEVELEQLMKVVQATINARPLS